MRPARSLLTTLAIAWWSLVPGAPAQAGPGPTEIAAIEATAPLENPSEDAVKAAIAAAVQKAARGAAAMGLPWLKIQSAYVRPGFVGVHVFAMATPPDEQMPEQQPGPGREPEPRGTLPDSSDEPPKIRL